MANFKNLSLALALVAMLSISLAVPMTTRNAHADTTTIYAATTGDSTGQALFSGGKTIMAEQITEDVDQLVNIEIDQIDVKLRKAGSPTGNVEVGIMAIGATTFTQSFGTIAASSLTTSYTEYSFSLSSNHSGYLLRNEGFLVAVKYTGGDNGGNHVDVRRAFNSVTGSDWEGGFAFKQYYTTSWHTNSDEDMWFELSNTYDNSGVTTDEFGNLVVPDEHACDQLNDLYGALPYISTPNTNINQPRCIIEETEAYSTFAEVGGSQNGNDVFLGGTSSYSPTYSAAASMPGIKFNFYTGTVDEPTILITSIYSSANGEANYTFENLSVGTHHLWVKTPINSAPPDCIEESSLSCVEDNGEDATRFTVVVS